LLLLVTPLSENDLIVTVVILFDMVCGVWSSCYFILFFDSSCYFIWNLIVLQLLLYECLVSLGLTMILNLF